MFKQQLLTFDTTQEFKEFLKGVKTMPVQYNRSVVEGHVSKMMDSLRAIGIQRDINLIYTNVFEEGFHYYTADGQHLIQAILQTPDHFLGAFTNIKVNFLRNRREIISFVSRMNSTAKNWRLKDYLNAWVTDGQEDYIFLRNKCLSTDLGLGGMIEAYMGRKCTGNTTFKNGEFKADKALGDSILNLYEEAVAVGLRPINSSFLALVRHFVTNPKISKDRFLSGIASNKNTFQLRMNRDAYIGLFKQHCS